MDEKVYFHKKNVLITGGLGFIGSNLAHKLTGYGANVTIIDNLNPLYGGNEFNIEEIKDKITIVINDIRNNEIILPLIKEADVIFHLAAQVSYIDSLNIPFEDLDVNVRATLNILELCRKYNPKVKIIFSSSRMVIGKPTSSIVTEDSTTYPLSLYGIHKLASEKYLLMYYKDFGIPCVILRLSNPYGPRQQIKHNKYSLVGWFIRQAMEGKKIQIFGDGHQLRDYIYSDDIVEGLIKCAAQPKAVGEIVNLGYGEGIHFVDMVNSVVKIIKTGSIEYIPWPGNYERVETGDIAMDISKLKSLTSWKPSVSLEDGIYKTYEYYKKYGDKYIL